MILLITELQNIKGDDTLPLEAYVLETGKDRKGLGASVIVKNGTMQTGEEIVTETGITKVRNIFGADGKSLKKIGPGEPGFVIGFSALPPVGSRIWNKGKENNLKVVAETSNLPVSAVAGQIPILVKSKSAGSLEALLNQLPKEIFVVGSGVGDVNESDVFLAKAGGAMIFVFEAGIPGGVAKLAVNEGVKIYEFNIIYELLDKLTEIIKGTEIEIASETEILTTFPFNGKLVAGCKVKRGTLVKTDSATLMRGEKEVGKIKILSMKKGKSDIDTAKQGEEFGLFFAPQLEFKVGDVVTSIRK
jgi:translation initiation factor IF-2